MLFHIFAHIDPHHTVLIVEQTLRQSLGKLCLSHSCRSQKQEGSNGFGRILDACLGADNGLRHLGHRLILSDDSPVENVVHVKGFAPLALRQLGDRDARPFGDNSGNLLLCHALVNQTQILIFNSLFLLSQLFFQLRQLSVLKLCGLVQVISLLGGLDLAV